MLRDGALKLSDHNIPDSTKLPPSFFSQTLSTIFCVRARVVMNQLGTESDDFFQSTHLTL